MAINLNNINSGPIRDSGRPDQASPQRPGNDTDSDVSGDRVELSQGAKALTALAEDTTPAVDAEKVEAIREAIAEGRYHVDPVRLAEKFIELEGEL